jgi:1-acyl-sn-glycerol-3-phosphate acyltransferase
VSRALDRLWRTLLTGSAFLLFFAGAAVLSYLAVPLVHLRAGSADERARRCRRVLRNAWVLFHDYLRVTRLLRYDPRTTALQLPAGPFVVVANHPTPVDVTALLAAMPDVVVVAKRAMFRNPLVGPLLRACDHIRADEDGFFAGTAVVEQALARLAAGTPVLIFPEGTRSPRGTVGTLRAGAFHIAGRARVPLVPLLLVCDPPTLMRGDRWYDVPSRTAVLTVTQLPARACEGGALALARSLEESYRQRLAATREDSREVDALPSLAASP